MNAASAPGKLMLFGEYAVLEGAPALVCAVDRRATVSIEPLPRGEPGQLHVPQLSARPIPFTWAEGALNLDCPRDLAPDLALARRLIEVNDLQSVRIQADTAPFFLGRRKLGLGSSAALTVAWTAAAEGSDDPDALRPRSHAVHQGFQQGRGSGADIAASCSGGVVLYRSGPPPTVRRLRWPEGVYWQAVWTGRSADTRVFLEGLSRWSRAEPAAYARHVDRLTALAEQAGDSFEGDGDALVGLVDDYHRGLRDLGQAAGLEIISAEHAHLASLAARCNVAYKPSGAGGGDFGFALSEDPEQLRRFGDAVGMAARSIPLAIDPLGVQLEADFEP